MKNIKTYNHGLAWESGSGISQGYSINSTIYISGQFSHDMVCVIFAFVALRSSNFNV